MFLLTIRTAFFLFFTLLSFHFPHLPWVDYQINVTREVSGGLARFRQCCVSRKPTWGAGWVMHLNPCHCAVTRTGHPLAPTHHPQCTWELPHSQSEAQGNLHS